MTYTLITAALVIGAIIIITTIFNKIHSKQQQHNSALRRRILESTISENKLTLTESEEINGHLIAIDEAADKLIHFTLHEAGNAIILNLKQLKSIQADVEETGIYETKKGKSIMTDKHVTLIQLRVTFKDSKRAVQQLPIYRYEDGMHELVACKASAKKWEKLVNQQIARQQAAVA